MRNFWIIIFFLLPFIAGLSVSCGTKKRATKSVATQQEQDLGHVDDGGARIDIEESEPTLEELADETTVESSEFETSEESQSEVEVVEGEKEQEVVEERGEATDTTEVVVKEEIPWDEEVEPLSKEMLKEELIEDERVDTLKPKIEPPLTDTAKIDSLKLIEPKDTVKKHIPTKIPTRTPSDSDEYESRPDAVVADGERRQDEDKKEVEYEADLLRPVKVGDSSVYSLIGNVVLYHNGAVITCDSAVRYDAQRMECFGRVIINQNTTYVYGDRADYDGDLNEARVYAPLVKIIDQDAVMYTYNCSFNTLNKIGKYRNGAIMTHKESQMESQRGYYYVDEQEFIGVGDVELSDPDYEMQSDSAMYNINTEVATFFTKSYIWNSKGEILSAERGKYSNALNQYNFSKNAYILTKEQEVWADSMDYNSLTENAKLWRDIQVVDVEHHTTAFGDYGEYWSEEQKVLLTEDPSVMNYDPQEADTLYMRADTMFVYTYDLDVVFETTTGLGASKPKIPDGEEMMMEEYIPEPAIDEGGSPQTVEAEQLEQAGESASEEIESVATSESELTESRGEESPPEALDEEASSERERGEEIEESPEIEQKSRAEIRREQKEAKRLERQRAREERQREKDAKRAEKAGEAVDSQIEGREEALSEELAEIDSLSLIDERGEVDTLDVRNMLDRTDLSTSDSLLMKEVDLQDSLATSERVLPEEFKEPEEKKDSVQRVFYGYGSAKIFREDFQAVCDSLVGFSIDTTLHLYIDPVLWNEENQITSDIMDIYTKNEELDRALFRGNPFMAGKVDSVRFNQIKGLEMEAFFRDNDIYRYEVVGNGQTYYYMEDDKTGDLMGFLTAECANITFLIDNRQMDKIIYRRDPIYTIYPMDKIPPTQEEFLPGFEWHEERRPAKGDVFNRVLRPSEREFYESLSKPLFPLTDSIHKEMERMIKAGIWKDRNEELSSTALEFIRSIEAEAEEKMRLREGSW